MMASGCWRDFSITIAWETNPSGSYAALLPWGPPLITCPAQVSTAAMIQGLFSQQKRDVGTVCWEPGLLHLQPRPPPQLSLRCYGPSYYWLLVSGCINIPVHTSVASPFLKASAFEPSELNSVSAGTLMHQRYNLCCGWWLPSDLHCLGRRMAETQTRGTDGISLVLHLQYTPFS